MSANNESEPSLGDTTKTFNMPGESVIEGYLSDPNIFLLRKFNNSKEVFDILDLLGCDMSKLVLEDNALKYEYAEGKFLTLTSVDAGGKVIFDKNLMLEDNKFLVSIIKTLRASKQIDLVIGSAQKIASKTGSVKTFLNDSQVKTRGNSLVSPMKQNKYNANLDFAYFVTSGNDKYLKPILENKWLNNATIINRLEVKELSVNFIETVSQIDDTTQAKILAKIEIKKEYLLGKVFKNAEIMLAVGSLSPKAQGVVVRWLDDNAIKNVDIELIKGISSLNDGPLYNLCRAKLQNQFIVDDNLFNAEVSVLLNEWENDTLSIFMGKIKDGSISNITEDLVEVIWNLKFFTQEMVIKDKISIEAVKAVFDKSTFIDNFSLLPGSSQVYLIKKLEDESIESVDYESIAMIQRIDEYAQIIFYHSKVKNIELSELEREAIQLDTFFIDNKIILSFILDKTKKK
jgi:hypothetical protein